MAKYPEPTQYEIPKKNILVLSCIDLRLTDDTLKFLHYDNLANRYDHFTIAGTSVCACVGKIHSKPADQRTKEEQTAIQKFDNQKLEMYDAFKHWRQTLDDHLNVAIQLHHIKDIYIIEHTNCGAYKEFLTICPVSDKEEEELHREFAALLAKELHEPIRIELKVDDQGVVKKEEYNIKVHNFLINLRGDVKHLGSFPPTS